MSGEQLRLAGPAETVHYVPHYTLSHGVLPPVHYLRAIAASAMRHIVEGVLSYTRSRTVLLSRSCGTIAEL